MCLQTYKRKKIILLSILFSLVPFLYANAFDFKPCGEIRIENKESCVVEKEKSCISKCTHNSLNSMCTVDRYNLCRDKCETGTLEPHLEDYCLNECYNLCDYYNDFIPSAELRIHYCAGLCFSNCLRYCSATELEKTSCNTLCNAACNIECYDSIKKKTKVTDCKTCCDTFCDGVFKITPTYTGCQAGCHNKEIPNCESERVKDCETQCDTSYGGVFCDGQFLDTNGNPEQCINILDEYLVEKVKVNENDEETSEGCSFTTRPRHGVLYILFLFLFGAFWALRR